MRWQALFDDLEAQLDAAEAAELQTEIADRTRREAALVRMVDRLRSAQRQPLLISVLGVGPVRGRLLDAGADWLLLEEAGQREVLVPVAAVLGISGLSAHAATPGGEGDVERRLDLRWALRGLARDRAGIAVVLRDGATISGTVDRVGADHVDLAEHPPGEPRRAAAVRQVRLVPISAVALVRGS